jgi:hypothetical protein
LSTVPNSGTEPTKGVYKNTQKQLHFAKKPKVTVCKVEDNSDMEDPDDLSSTLATGTGTPVMLTLFHCILGFKDSGGRVHFGIV